jgi:AGZA family xanthine/uracil permease-like MFS transporter
MDDALSAAGTTADKVGEDALTNAGLVYHGTALLGGGAILAGLVLGSITAFVIDKRFFAAAAYSLGGAVLGFIGLIHAQSVGWGVGGQIALGYLFAGIVLLAFGLVERRRANGNDGHGADAAPAAVDDEEAAALPEPREEQAPATATAPTSTTASPEPA